MEDGLSQRVRKILAGVPASVSFRDLILALSLSREERQHWTVGNRPIRKNDLRSLRRYSGGGANSRSFTPKDRVKYRPGLFTRLSVIPADAGTQEKTKHTASPPSLCEGGRERSEQGDARNSPQLPLNQQRVPTPVIPAYYPVIPAYYPVIPADYLVIPADAGTQRKTRQAVYPTPRHPPFQSPAIALSYV